VLGQDGFDGCAVQKVFEAFTGRSWTVSVWEDGEHYEEWCVLAESQF
jgi:heme-degrading monooxygenase HmoA